MRSSYPASSFCSMASARGIKVSRPASTHASAWLAVLTPYLQPRLSIVLVMGFASGLPLSGLLLLVWMIRKLPMARQSSRGDAARPR